MSKETITDFNAGERLDKELSRLFSGYSRSSIEKLIEHGSIVVNNHSVKTKYILKQGDTISANFSALERETEEIKLPIIYEDSNVIVINKPAGILAHSKGAFNKEGTVASWLKAHILNPRKTGQGAQQAQDDTEDNFWSSNRAGIVHRLDRGTSGVMIVAKNEATQKHLQKQFAKRNVKKTYNAIVSNTLPQNQGTIDIPIERNPKKPATFRAGANGKSAQTDFNVLRSNNTHALVELRPHTGRTHQLRVHLAYLKCPIVGDDFYKGQSAERLMLHATKLEITLLGGQRSVFESPLPKEFESFLQ